MPLFITHLNGTKARGCFGNRFHALMGAKESRGKMTLVSLKQPKSGSVLGCKNLLRASLFSIRLFYVPSIIYLFITFAFEHIDSVEVLSICFNILKMIYFLIYSSS